MTTIFNVIRPQAMPTKIHNQWYGLQTLNQTLQTKLTDSHKPASTQFFPYNNQVDFTSLPRFHPTQILPPPRLLSQPSHHTLNLFWVTWVSDLLSLSIESDLIWLFGYKVGEFWDLDLFSLPSEIRFWVRVAVYIFSAFPSTNWRIRPHCTNKDHHQHGRNLNHIARWQFVF